MPAPAATPVPGCTVWFITHPDVVIDPSVPVPEWPLAPRGADRMRAMLAQPWVDGLDSIWSSTERKARDSAGILAAHLGIEARSLHELGEIDRSSTGYLPRHAFEDLADSFFANPAQSVQGWECAVDAQRRIISSVTTVLTCLPPRQRVAIVSHGAVGALLLAHLLGRTISRDMDQPAGAGGHYFCFNGTTWFLHHPWKRIDDAG